MKIALDYDDTYTRDPKLWNSFIEQAQQRGHYIFIVTFRHGGSAINIDLEAHIGVKLPVIYTGGQRKRAFCAARDLFPDVWIDDMPEIIGAEDAYIPGETSARNL